MKSLKVKVGGHEVDVDISFGKDLFNCGIPGYNMAEKDVAALTKWVPTAIIHEKTKEKAKCLPPKQEGASRNVNVYFKGAKSFNFHINLK